MAQPALPITNETLQEFYEWILSPWVKELSLRDYLKLQIGFVTGKANNPNWWFYAG